MTIKYIDDDKTLFSILSLCKDFNEMLRNEVVKQSLLRASQHNLKKKRRNLWLNIL